MMNQKQQENLAKLCYDLSKIMVAIPILGNVLAENFSLRVFWFGLSASVGFLVFGLLLDGRMEEENDKP